MTDSELTRRVTEAVHSAIQAALEVDPAEITAEATIMDDLDAESIDLLDLRFRLEKALDLRITNEDLVAAFSEADSDEAFRKAFTVGAMCAYLIKRLEAESG